MSRVGKGMVVLRALFCFIALVVVPQQAGAEPAIAVEVDCPAMTPEQRASVEARARAELALVGITGGDIEVHCWPPLVVVQYSTGGVPVRSSSQHLTGDPGAWVDGILSMVHVLLSPQAESNNAPIEATNTLPQPEAKPNPELAPVGKQAEPRVAEKSSPPPPSASSWKPDASGRGEPLTRQMGVGLCAEAWAKPLAILPGVCALVGLRSSLARIALVGGVQWSASRVYDIGVRHWQAGVEASFGRAVWFAVSGQLSVFRLAPRAELLPEASTTYDPAVTARVGVSLPIAREHLLAGVGLRLQPAHDVYINGQSKFSLPNVALTTDVAYEFDW